MVMMIWLLIMLVMSPLLSKGYMDISEVMGEPNEEIKESDGEIMDQIRFWLNQIITETLPHSCLGQNEDVIPKRNSLIRHVPCHEEGALKRYFFNGTFSPNLKLDGKGIVMIREDAPEQQRCIYVNDRILGLSTAPDLIQGQFDAGVVIGVAHLSWSSQNVHLTTHVKYGAVHGMFKIHDVQEDKWMVGTAKVNQISDPCWLYWPSKVEAMYVQCTGAFQFNGTIQTPAGNPVTLFTVNMTVVSGGYQKDPLDTNVLHAYDVHLAFVQKAGQCSLAIATVGSGIPFEYNIQTGIRDYKLEQNDLCNGQTVEMQADQIPKFIKNYMDRAAPVPMPNDKLNLDQATLFLQDITHIKDNVYDAVLHYFDTLDITFEYIGRLDANGLFQGYAVLKLKPLQQCLRGICTTIEFQSIRGSFKHGVLDGMAYVTSHKDILISYLPLKNGVIHGLVLISGLTNLYPIPQREDLKENKFYQKQKGIGRIAQFLNGRLVEDQPVWQGLMGYPVQAQGFLYGALGQNAKMSGNNVAYIYPGARVALLGKFKDNYMISARKAHITKASCRENLISLEFSPPGGPEYFFDPGTNISLGSMPLVEDPYEAMTVKLDTSIIPGSGQGIFAVRDIEPNEVIALYNGLHFPGKAEIDAHKAHCQNSTEGATETEKKAKCFKYRIYNLVGELLNIPPWLDDIQLYNATLAHKVNNKFPPFTNCAFGSMEHPRFGAIVILSATRHIKAGEEIFVNYGYPLNAAHIKEIYPWYKEQYLATKAYMAKVAAGEDVTDLPVP